MPSDFDSISKLEERGAVLALYQSVLPKKGILYLDDHQGSATKFFKAAVPSSHLFPVNWNREACEEIEKATGVKPVHASIGAHLLDLDSLHGETPLSNSNKLFSVIWLDLMARTLNPCVLKSALSLSHVVKVALSTRGSSAEGVMDAFKITARAAGGIVHSLPCSYKGASNVMNMIKLTVVEKGGSVTNKAKREAKRARSESDEAIWKRRRVLSAEALVGKTVALPVSEWTSLKDYEKVKNERGCLHFQLTATYYKRALVLQAIMEDGRLHKKKEKWVLSVEDALRFSK
jgi:hypothetical protein